MSFWPLIRKLGEGGTGEVFLAQTPEGAKVAVKILSTAQKDQLPLFEQEAKLLTQLRHPAIASVLGYLVKSEEIFGEERGPCFWMEYVEGKDLLNAAQNKRPEEIVEWLKQALEALRYLHGQSIFHGDLSPRNVLVDKSGKLKLLDFGLASSFLGSARFNAGTLPYLAPERIYGKNLAASDLFSMGTLFYEALSGKHPRENCRSLQEMIRKEAKPLAEAVPALAKDFGLQTRVIDRMIRIPLEERFSQADDVLEALAGGEAQILPLSSAEYYPAQMTGREEAFQKISEGFKSLLQQSTVIGLHGITGVGKKRFLKETKFQCALSGIEVRDAAPLLLQEALTSVREENSKAPRAFLFSSLENLSPSDFPLLLSLVKTALSGKGFLIVLEWNDDRLEEGHERFFKSLSDLKGFQEIILKNLNPSEARSLLDAGLGRDVSREIGTILFDQTQGNPRMLLETVKTIRELKLDSKKHFSRDWVERIRSLSSFDDILVDRLKSVSEEENEILLSLTTAHEPVGLEALAQMRAMTSPPGGAGVPPLPSLLQRLMDRNLVEQDEKSFLFRISIPALEQSLLNAASPSKIEERHRNWLKVLAEKPRFDLQKLRHALFLRDSQITTALAGPVSEGLLQRGEKTEGLKLLNASLELVFDPAEASKLLRLKANLLTILGRFEEALAVCDEILALAAPDEPLSLKKVKYFTVTAKIRQNLGDPAEAKARLEKALQEGAGLSDPEIQAYHAHARSMLGVLHLNQGDFEKAKEHFQKGLVLAGPKGGRRAEILRSLAAVHAREGHIEKMKEALDEAKENYREVSDHGGEFSTLLQEGNLSLEMNDPMSADQAYLRAEKLAREKEDELNLATVWNNRGVLARKRSDLSEALNFFSRSHEIFKSLGGIGDLAESLTQFALTRIAVGQFSRALEDFRKLTDLTEKFPKAQQLAEQVEGELKELRDGIASSLPPEKIPAEPLLNFWDKESALKILGREAKDSKSLETILKDVYEKLPVPLKVSFVDRADYRKWVLKK